MWPEGLSQWKFQMTPSGVETAIFRLGFESGRSLNVLMPKIALQPKTVWEQLRCNTLTERPFKVRPVLLCSIFKTRRIYFCELEYKLLSCDLIVIGLVANQLSHKMLQNLQAE
jgi:hypothetical protein